MMLLTEKQARKKWCPWTLAEGSYVSRNPVNRGLAEEGQCNCLASDCMAWVTARHNPKLGYCARVEKAT